MARYRMERTLPTNWRIRLDYIPWDGSLDDAVTAVDGVSLLEIGDQVNEFDSLPFGMVQPQTLKLKLALTSLPSALQAYIRTGRETVLVGPLPKVLRRNIFVLYSDRGTNGAAWTTEYIGCEDDTEGFEATPGGGDTYEYEVELVDVVYHALKTMIGKDTLVFYTGQTLPETVYHKFWYLLMLNTVGQNVYQSGEAQVLTVANVLEWIMVALRKHLASYYLHGLAYPADVTTSGFSGLFTSALELKNCNTDQPPRVAGTALTASSAYLTTHVALLGFSLGDNSAGGLMGIADKYGWRIGDTTVYDVMRDLCETLGVKMAYNVAITYGPSASAAVTFTPLRIGSPLAGNASVTGIDAKIACTKMLARPTIRRGADNVTKAETRWETEYNEDVKEIVRLRRGTDGSRSVNVEPIIHNAPTYLPEADEDDGRSGPFLQSNLIYFKSGGSVHLAHENTRYYYLPGTPGNYVQVTTTAGQQPVVHDDNEGNYRIQLNSIQANACMPYALTQLLLHVFSDANNATIEAPFSALLTSEMLPAYTGAVYDLSTDDGVSASANYATLLPNMAWTRAVLTSSSHDWMTGKIQTKFFLMAATGNVG